MSAEAIPQNDNLQALVETLHSELRRLAHRERYRLGGSDTLQTTALVNEAYLKLFRKGHWQDRAHFLNAAAMAMRQVLVSHAREGLAQKRGAGAVRVSLDETENVETKSLLAESDERIVAIEDALVHLEAREPRLARVVECRYFAGYIEQETATALGINERTVRRNWATAKDLFYRALGAD
jgi:RNA polymerase sigma factor (TIGR02999 family)